MNEIYPSLAHGPAISLPREAPGGRFGEVASALAVLALAGLGLLLLVSTLEAGRESFGSAGAPPVAQGFVPGLVHHSGVHLYIVVAGEDRADEVAFSLARESAFRVSLGEAPRDAEVIATSSHAEAVALAYVINNHNNVPGAAPMAAVVVR